MTFDEVIKSAELHCERIEPEEGYLGFEYCEGRSVGMILIYDKYGYHDFLPATVEGVLAWCMNKDLDLDSMLQKLTVLKDELEVKVESKHNKLAEWKLKLNEEY